MPRKRPVVVCYIPLSIREAIDLGAAPKRNGLQVSVFACQVILQVVCQDGDVKVVLEGSFRLLYPHLVEFYSFIDFDGARASGGAGAQVNTLKAFIGAGIVNRIIAIFDNDTAAKVATRSLREIRLPDTVRVLLYPDLELARNYPTLGPQGISSMDVNGLAAGIELYLGDDVLRQSDGALTPVQWRGYLSLVISGS